MTENKTDNMPFTGTPPPPIKKPTVGRIVHFFPLPFGEFRFKTRIDPQYYNQYYPAIVMDDDTYPTLTIFIEKDEKPCIVIRTVAHKSCDSSEHKTAGGYWDWPEIK